MSLHLITGYKGSPHITAADQGMFHAGFISSGDVVLPIGRMFEAQVISNNTIRIYDGCLLMQGRNVNLENGTYEDVTISNGSQSMYRNDLIIARYEKSLVSGIEKVTFAVIQGTSASGTATDPACTKGDILSGSTLHEMPLYRVKLSGLSIESIEPLFDTMIPLYEVGKHYYKQNMLVNGDFNSNQRGSTTYEAESNAAYSIDMWRIHQLKLEVLNEGIKLTGKSSTATGYFTQFVPVINLSPKYTISAMVDDKICTFTSALSGTAVEKDFGKFKITALTTSVWNDAKNAYDNKVKVNICPNGTNSIVVKYVDLFEGSLAYPHVKEDAAIARMRCRRFIQRNSGTCTIVYSYPSGDLKSYKFTSPCDGMVTTPTMESCGWGYYDASGNWISGDKSTLHTVSEGYSNFTIRTPFKAAKQADVYAIDFWCVATCEPTDK